MTTYVPFDRSQPFLLPPDLKDWLPEDDIAHFIVAAVDRVRLGAFRTNSQSGGKPQYHPRLMLALLVYSYANGIFSSRRIERATWRDIGVRFIAANTHPDHDTIATFRRANQAAFEAACRAPAGRAGRRQQRSRRGLGRSCGPAGCPSRRCRRAGVSGSGLA